MAELVTVVEAARRLNLSHSTVSRQVEKLGIARNGAGEFDFDEYARRRDAELNPLKGRNKGDVLGYEDSLDAGESGSPAAPAPDDDDVAEPEGKGRTAAVPSDLQRAHTAEKALRARMLQVQLAEKLGQLVDVETVRQAAMTAGAILQSLLAERAPALAEEFASMRDAAEIETRLAASDRDVLGKLAEKLKELLPMESARAA